MTKYSIMNIDISRYLRAECIDTVLLIHQLYRPWNHLEHFYC